MEQKCKKKITKRSYTSTQHETAIHINDKSLKQLMEFKIKKLKKQKTLKQGK